MMCFVWCSSCLLGFWVLFIWYVLVGVLLSVSCVGFLYVRLVCVPALQLLGLVVVRGLVFGSCGFHAFGFCELVVGRCFGFADFVFLVVCVYLGMSCWSVFGCGVWFEVVLLWCYVVVCALAAYSVMVVANLVLMLCFGCCRFLLWFWCC